MTAELPVSMKPWKAFAGLADTLAAGFDIIDFLDLLCEHSTSLPGVAACGILMSDHAGGLTLVAASTEQARAVELFQLRHAEGPCLDSYHSRTPMSCPDLAAAASRWPVFAPAALEAGFAAVHALPMHLRDQTVGVVALYAASPGALDASTAELGQALADVATIGILNQRAVSQHETVIRQLQNALNSRVAVEQAKGFLAARLGVSLDEAFSILRSYARDHNLRLSAAARLVTEDALDIPATWTRPGTKQSTARSSAGPANPKDAYATIEQS